MAALATVQPSTPQRGEATNGNGDFIITVSRLVDLVFPEDAEEDRPTRHAYELALNLIVEAHDQLRASFPSAAINASETGDINLYWLKPDYSVQLTTTGSLSGKSYLYVRDHGVSSITDDVTVDSFVSSLQNFNNQPE